MLTELADEREGKITLTPRLYTRTSRRLRGATGIEQDLKRFINGSSGRFISSDLQDRKIQDPHLAEHEDQATLLGNAADMGKISDGTMDGERWCTGRRASSSDQFREEQSDVYVSVLDPVGEPAFKPSQLKPLPRWMNLLPNNVHRGRGQKIDVFFKYDSQQQPKAELSTTEDEDADSIGSSGDSRCSPIALVDIPNLRGGGRITLPLNRPERSRHQWERKAVFFESTYTADGNGGQQCPQALEPAADALYSVPLDPASNHSQLARRRTPYPQDFPGLSTLRGDASASVRQRKNFDIIEEAAHEPCCPLGLQLRQRTNSHDEQPSYARRETQTYSERFTPSIPAPSEYLDRNELRWPRPEKHRPTAGKGAIKPGSPRSEMGEEQNRAKSIRNKRKNKFTIHKRRNLPQSGK